jgi:hypothetical protein
MRTSIGLFYSANSGQRFTYLVNGDLNSDGRFSNDLLYVPQNGQYTERNGSSTPWEHVIDMRIAQDFYITRNDVRHTLQVTFDLFNLTNLINREWGRQFTVTNQAYTILTTINRSGGAVKGYNYTPNQLPWSMSFASRFQGQVGLRYSFN